ncbi:LACCASE-7 [Salix purpurea]|uniref:LACCASE-7 n=1 Tax=Salix purpurea TaxID=77065 RepID=A0A9Q0T309_SALPP|nr:LACCASE-7 [Salix purpurea]
MDSPGISTLALKTVREVGSYYMAANAYVSDAGVPFNSTATRGIVVYEGAPTTASPIMPLMPAFNDTPTAHKFFTTITGLAGGPHWVPVPHQIDEHMFVTVNMGISACPTCLNGTRLSASMNNYSFVNPTSLSLLQAFYFNVSGIYTPDFPDTPPVKFDYTNDSINILNSSLLITPKSTSVKVLKYNSTVWIMHCHLDVHLPLGLATAFVVENGPTKESTLPPPPPDLPRC